MRGRLFQVVLIVLISFLVGFYIGTKKIEISWQNFRPSAVVYSKDPPPSLTNLDFSLFWNVWQKVENSFYDKTQIDPQKMLNGAISGMVQSLEDPFTVYLPLSQNKSFKQGLAGQFSGIGAELGTKENQIIVIAPLDGSPAQKSGVKAGDAIIKVDGELSSSWSLSTVVEKIRGPKGTKITLNVMHKNSTETQDITITRDIITVKSVTGWIKKIKDIESISTSLKLRGASKSLKDHGNEEVSYIRLSQFGDSTNKDWLSLVGSFNLKMQKGQNVKGLILDLRNNPGGYLNDAVFIASEFLKQGKTVVKQETSEKIDVSVVTRQGLFLEIPLIVLLNKGSASASEIVAAAIADNKRGTLIGETSFGKGTIQQAYDLGDGAGVHITVAKWLTPKGTWVTGEGIKPDIEVAMDEKDKDRDLQLERAVEELVQ